MSLCKKCKRKRANCAKLGKAGGYCENCGRKEKAKEIFDPRYLTG